MDEDVTQPSPPEEMGARLRLYFSRFLSFISSCFPFLFLLKFTFNGLAMYVLLFDTCPYVTFWVPTLIVGDTRAPSS